MSWIFSFKATVNRLEKFSRDFRREKLWREEAGDRGRVLGGLARLWEKQRWSICCWSPSQNPRELEASSKACHVGGWPCRPEAGPRYWTVDALCRWDFTHRHEATQQAWTYSLPIPLRWQAITPHTARAQWIYRSVNTSCNQSSCECHNYSALCIYLGG